MEPHNQKEKDEAISKTDNNLKGEIKDGGEKNTNQATILTNFALSQIDLFVDRNKQVFAKEKSTNQIWSLASRQFIDWLMSSFYNQNKKTISMQSLKETVTTLSGIGRAENFYREIHTRIAKFNDDYFIDLCQSGNSKAIKISAGSWEIVEEPPVIFFRSDSMQPLPDPLKEEGYDLENLWSICNIPFDCQILVVTYLIETLRPETPYPLLEILGEQGSAKSTSQAFLRSIFDPNTCDLRATPKSAEDLFVAAGSNHLLSYENVSHLTSAIQDAFCTIATGGGFAKRKFYFDCDEVILHAKNPVMINGISAVITAPDLIDRTISIDLPAITNREETPALRAKFTELHSKILGTILNIFSTALSKLPTIETSALQRPRLIEFAKLGMSISETLGLSRNHFMDAFNRSRLEAIERTISDNPVITALFSWFDAHEHDVIELPLHELLKALEDHRPHKTDSWPKTNKSFGDTLRRLAPPVRLLGLNIKSLGKRGAHIRWQISRCESSVKQSLAYLHVSQQKDMEDIQDINLLK